ncbi:MAG: hypothetical protein ABEJ83_02690 [Candidatus Nanohaloarchaea archaeon]
MKAKNQPIPIFFFRQEEPSEWKYEGLVDVEDYKYVEQNGRMVYKFNLVRRDQEVEGLKPSSNAVDIERPKKLKLLQRGLLETPNLYNN